MIHHDYFKTLYTSFYFKVLIQDNDPVLVSEFKEQIQTRKVIKGHLLFDKNTLKQPLILLFFF